MEKIIPVSDLQRQASSILNEVNRSAEPIVITQRGRVSAVLISAKRYAEMEEDLALLDDLEVADLIEKGLKEKAEGKTISLDEAKKKLHSSTKK